MELPRRERGDELLPLGEMTDIRRRLKALAAGQDLATVIACAFDHRTRMLPFIVADLRMAPAGVRALGAELFESGFEKTRIVLQQWNRNFSPSEARLDGRLPDLLCLSTMQMHWDPCRKMIRDACRIDPDKRPLVLVGGPKAIYEPWDAFSDDPNDPWAADLVVTGESYVLLSVLERLMTVRGQGEPLRKTYLRARDEGVLDDIPGLVYANGPAGGPPEELVDTGIQQLCGDLNEMADVVTPYRLLEPPGRGRGLSSQPLPASRVKRYSPLSSLVLTLGCRFGCQYCPIPGYNQRQYRTKGGERIVDEIRQLHLALDIRNFFGTDDNFFNDHQRTAHVLETMMNAKVGDKMLRHCARIGTETTIHDGWELRHLLPMARKAGIRALWFGVEDLSGTLVRKGQTADKTIWLFQRLRQLGIAPMPMMMHHDDQALVTSKDRSGLLNQVRLLQKAGAATLQVLMITPSPGSKLYDQTYTSGMVFDSVGRRKIEPYMIDGNYVIASHHPSPWRKQFSIMAAYLMFYNPFRLLAKILDPNTRVKNGYIFLQMFGMYGLSQTIRRTLGYGFRLIFSRIKRLRKPPQSTIPMRSVEGGRASHALDETPEATGEYVSQGQPVASGAGK